MKRAHVLAFLLGVIMSTAAGVYADQALRGPGPGPALVKETPTTESTSASSGSLRVTTAAVAPLDVGLTVRCGSQEVDPERARQRIEDYRQENAAALQETPAQLLVLVAC